MAEESPKRPGARGSSPDPKRLEVTSAAQVLLSSALWDSQDTVGNAAASSTLAPNPLPIEPTARGGISPDKPRVNPMEAFTNMLLTQQDVLMKLAKRLEERTMPALPAPVIQIAPFTEDQERLFGNVAQASEEAARAAQAATKLLQENRDNEDMEDTEPTLEEAIAELKEETLGKEVVQSMKKCSAQFMKVAKKHQHLVGKFNNAQEAIDKVVSGRQPNGTKPAKIPWENEFWDTKIADEVEVKVLFERNTSARQRYEHLCMQHTKHLKELEREVAQKAKEESKKELTLDAFERDVRAVIITESDKDLKSLGVEVPDDLLKNNSLKVKKHIIRMYRAQIAQLQANVKNARDRDLASKLAKQKIEAAAARMDPKAVLTQAIREVTASGVGKGKGKGKMPGKGTATERIDFMQNVMDRISGDMNPTIKWRPRRFTASELQERKVWLSKRTLQKNGKTPGGAQGQSTKKKPFTWKKKSWPRKSGPAKGKGKGTTQTPKGKGKGKGKIPWKVKGTGKGKGQPFGGKSKGKGKGKTEGKGQRRPFGNFWKGRTKKS